MTKRDSFVSVIIPIALILLAFFFMEQYDQKAKHLKQAKEVLIESEESIRRAINYPTPIPTHAPEPELGHLEADKPPALHPSNRNIGHFEISLDHKDSEEQLTEKHSESHPVRANVSDSMDLGHFSRFISGELRSENIRNRGHQHAYIDSESGMAQITTEVDPPLHHEAHSES